MAINEKREGDCGYVAHYNGKRCEVYAGTMLTAQSLAAAHFKAKKSWQVNVTLAEASDGKPVVHLPLF